MSYFFSSAADGPDILSEELYLVKNMNLAIREERYKDAGMIEYFSPTFLITFYFVSAQSQYQFTFDYKIHAPKFETRLCLMTGSCSHVARQTSEASWVKYMNINQS